MMKKYCIASLLCISSSLFSQEITNLSYVKHAIQEYYVSGRYEKEVSALLSQAEKYLLQRVAANQLSSQPQKLAVVLDIDDTSLSTFPALRQQDFSLEHIEANHAKAKAPAIKPMLEFYRLAQKKGVSLFFITMRSHSLRTYTITNLRRAGYTAWAGLYLPKRQEQQYSYKAKIRKQLVQQGFHIILNIGDQKTDLMGGYADKTVKLPNPMYSSKVFASYRGSFSLE